MVALSILVWLVAAASIKKQVHLKKSVVVTLFSEVVIIPDYRLAYLKVNKDFSLNRP